MPKQMGPRDTSIPGEGRGTDVGARDISIPNPASEKEKAEGSRENVQSGITNRPIEEEQREQQNLPPRGESKAGGHA